MWGYLQVKCVFGGAGAILCVPRLNGGACLASSQTELNELSFTTHTAFNNPQAPSYRKEEVEKGKRSL